MHIVPFSANKYKDICKPKRDYEQVSGTFRVLLIVTDQTDVSTHHNRNKQGA